MNLFVYFDSNFNSDSTKAWSIDLPCPARYLIFFSLREDINTKKKFSFGHCPNHLTPPPPDPNSGNLVLFFGRQNSRFESHLRTN